MRTERHPAGMLLCVIFASVILFPFLYAALASFFSASEFAVIPAKLLPENWDFRNYLKIASNRYFPSYIVNSIITGILSASIRMILAILASYAFSYFRFLGRNLCFAFVILTLFIPSDLLLAGNYFTIQKLGLIDTYAGIIATSLLPASQIIMLRQYFLSIPSCIRDSARMDGAGDFCYIIRILVPVSRAILSTFLLQSFVAMFNSYLWPLLVTNRPDMRTIQIGITMLGYAESLNYGPVFAAITVILIPFVIAFILMRKRIMSALSRGYMFM